MKHLLDSFFIAVMVTGIFVLVGDGYGMYWASVELKFKNKKQRVLLKSLPILLIVIFTILFMRCS